MSYSDVGQVLDMLLAACTRSGDRAMVYGSVNCGGADTGKQP